MAELRGGAVRPLDPAPVAQPDEFRGPGRNPQGFVMNFLLHLPRGLLQLVFRGGVRFGVQQLVHFLVRIGADVIGVGDEAAAFVVGVAGMEALFVHRMGRCEAPGHEGGLNALFHDFAEGHRGVQRVQLDFQAALAGVFLQLAQRGSQGGGGVGERYGGGETRAVRLAEDSVRARDGVAGPGEAGAGLFRRVGPGLDVGIGEFAEAGVVGVEPLVVSAEGDVNDVLDVQGVLEAQAHVQVIERGLGGVQEEAVRRPRINGVKRAAVDVAVVHFRDFHAFVPQLRLRDVHHVQLADAEKFNGLGRFRDEVVHDLVHVVHVLGELLVPGPPVRNALHRYLAPTDNAVRLHHVSACGGGYAPLVAFHVAGTEFTVEVRGGRDEQRAVVREQRLGEGKGDGEAAVVVDGDVGGVLVKEVVVENVPAVFRGADVHVHQQVNGLYLGSVRVAGVRVQFKVNGAPVRGFRPFMGNAGNDFSGDRMDGDEADDDFIIQGAAEAAVAVRAVGAERVRVGTRSPLAQHAAFPGVRVAYFRIVQPVFPLKVLGDVRRGLELDVVSLRLPAVDDGQGRFIRNELALELFPDLGVFLLEEQVTEALDFLLLGGFFPRQAFTDLFVPPFREGFKPRWKRAEGHVRLPAHPLGLGGILAAGAHCQQKGQRHGGKDGAEDGGQLEHGYGTERESFIYRW